MDIKTSYDWGGLRYFPISQFYQQRFGQKVYKLSVSVAETCPVRLGKEAEDICIFCDEWGSAAAHLRGAQPSLAEQISQNREKVQARFGAKKFLVYFQPYTNTFTRLENLKRNLYNALEQDQVAGVVLGTRPDCLPKGIFPLLAEIQSQAFLSVELGAQSLVEERVAWLKRGHTAQKSLEAIEKLAEHVGCHVGLHLIFGIPGETPTEAAETALAINRLPIHDVKLHHLHVLKNTHLQALYEAGQFQPLELSDYARKVVDFLVHLSPEIAVQRLAATAANWEELIAPEWTKWKMKPIQAIQDLLQQENLWQGKASGHPFQLWGLSKSKENC